MKNITNTLIAAIAIASSSFTSAFAGMTMGVVGSIVDASASGTETDRLTAAGANVADTSTRTKSVSERGAAGSIYLEYTMSESSYPLVFGVEVTPGTVDISNKLSRTDTVLSQTGSVLNTAIDVTRSAEATATGLGTVYIEAPLFAGLYVKGGLARMTVNHANDSKMSNSTNINGTNYGAGWKTETAGGLTVKLSYEETNYDTINLRSTVNSVAANSSAITGEIDTKAYRFSIGKAF